MCTTNDEVCRLQNMFCKTKYIVFKINMLATVIAERPGNAFSGIIINISPNLESISVHKSLDTIESSSIINNFTSDNLFLKTALDL